MWTFCPQFVIMYTMIEKLKDIRVGLDIDGVLSCFSAGVIERAKQLGLSDKFPASCKEVDCWDMSDTFSKVMKDAWRDDKFWLELPVLEGASPLPFEPYVYITSRQISGVTTKQWLDKHGFHDAPVITVSHPKEKLSHVINMKLDVYVDDLYSTVKEMREAGVNAILMQAPYQSGHEEECKGLPVIKSLDEVINYI